MRSVVVLFSVFITLVAAAAELPRKLLFGAQLLPGATGVTIGQLTPGAPAASAGLQTGDTILSIGGTAVARPEEFVAALRRRSAGVAELEIVRDGQPAKVNVMLAEVPRESSADYEVVYDSVSANGALRRTIITRPHGDGRRPAVLFVGGIGCYSLDGAPAVVNGYIALIQELTRRGFVVMRVEKSGMGDSTGVPCPLQDFDNELAGYRAGLQRLRAYEYVDADKIFIIGHSIGGIVAPVLASESPVRGVVALSTAGHRWLDYEDINALRQTKMEGKRGAELKTALALRHQCAASLMAEKKTPEEILAGNPACAESLQYPAHYTYMQQVAALDPVSLWKKVSAPVLLIHGASDFVTDAEEHRVIQRAVNAVHRNNATLVVEPRMDHFMRDVATADESMRVLKSGALDRQPLQTRVRDDIAAWLKAHS